MAELIVELDRSSAVNLHLQLEASLREQIQSGTISPGTELPSSRALAAEIGVSRGVVVEAYAQLRAEGYLTIGDRSRTRVAKTALGPGGAEAEVPMPEPQAPRWDFHPGHPDLDGFPRLGWTRALRATIKDLPGRRMAYGDLRGDAGLRRSLCGHLARSRSVAADPERMLICQGVQHGLGLACQVLRARGVRRLAVEDPTLPTHSAVIADSGIEPVPIAVDEDGMKVRELAGADVQAALVTPAHQFPLGSVLSPQRRADLIEWARAVDAIVMEDDYDAEYRYDREPVGALQGLAPDIVVYAGSTSKLLAPGLRVGWMLLPERLYPAALERKAFAGGISPIFEQLALAEFIESEAFYRHLRRMRRRYRKRRDAMVAALAEELPEARVVGVAAGLHVLALMPEGIDENAIAAAALARGVSVHPLGWHRAVPAPEEPGFILGYAGQTEPAIHRGVAELARAVEEVADA